MAAPEAFTLPTSGAVVQLRGLTGFEVMLSRKKYRDDELSQNVFILACAMDVAEGVALEWVKTELAGDFQAAIDRVQVLSGLGEGADKSAVRDVR